MDYQLIISEEIKTEIGGKTAITKPPVKSSYTTPYFSDIPHHYLFRSLRSQMRNQWFLTHDELENEYVFFKSKDFHRFGTFNRAIQWEKIVNYYGV